MTDSAYAPAEDAIEPANEDDVAEPVGKPDWLQVAITSTNLAFEMDESELSSIGEKVCEEFEMDWTSLENEGWFDRNEQAMKLAMQVKEDKSYPWPGASNVKYPLLTTASIQFAARAYGAIVPGFNVVKGKVLGKPTPEKADRAERISAHMSYQLLEEMPGWEEDTDRLLHMLPITGCVFRKTFFDPVSGKNVSNLVAPDKLIANYWTKSIDTCPRMTHVCEYYPNEIEERFRSELWKRCDLGQPEGDDPDDPYAVREFLEQHRLLDLDDDGMPEPYVVMVHRESRQVVRITARFDEDGIIKSQRGDIIRINPVRYFTKYPFIPSPDGSFYDTGFGALLGPLSETINTTLNQLMDAGHLANVQGGFIGSGISMKSGNMRMKPGQWSKVESMGGNIRDNIVPLNMPGPNPVLFELLQFLLAAARDVTSTKDVLTGDTTPQNQPVGTTMALIEQGLKVYSAIFKRIHRAFKWELDVLYRLNRKYLNPEGYFVFQDKDGVIAQKDYESKDVDVIPVSDPTVVMDSQRLSRAQYLNQYMPLPFMNQKELVKRSLEAADIPDIDQLFAPQGPDPKTVLEGQKMSVQVAKTASDHARVAAQNKLTEAQAVKTVMEAAALAEQYGIDPMEFGNIQSLEGSPTDGGVPSLPSGQPPSDSGQMGGGGNPPGGGPDMAGASPNPVGPGNPDMGGSGGLLQPQPGS